jgi:hypothetical protein
MRRRSSAELYRAEHRRPEGEPDAFGRPVRANVHLIALNGGLDHREQPSAVIVDRKRARDEVGREIRKVEPLHLGVARTGSLEDGAQIGQRPELYRGGVAAALHGIEGFGLGRFPGSEAVADDHAAAGKVQW